MDVISFQNSVKYFCAVSTCYTAWEFKWAELHLYSNECGLCVIVGENCTK